MAGAVWGCGLLLASPAMVRAQENGSQQQQNQSQNQSQKQSQNQSGQANAPKKDQKKSTAQSNPFPEAQSEAAAKQSQQQSGDQDAGPPAPQQGKPSTAAQNPFPESESEKAAHPDGQKQPGSGVSSSGDSSSSQVKGLDLPDTDAGATAAPPGPLAYNPKLAKKDVQVGTFYLQTGDSKGAYSRFAEATRSDPDNAEAVYGLAASAQRIGRRDEALRNYRLYLSALPDGPHAKEVRKAMKEMGAPPA